MTSIAVAAGLDADKGTVAVTKMLEALRRRSPGEPAVFREQGGPAVIGYRSVTFEPRRLVHDLFAAAIDGRIDNHEELTRRFGFQGSTIEGFIVALYQMLGDRFPASLVGDFALVIWNRETKSLFCARDALGVKPLVYSRIGDALLVASSVEALISSGIPSLTIDEDRVAESFYPLLEGFDRERSYFRDIKRLPPGHTLHWRAGRVAISQYWSIADAPQLPRLNHEEYAHRFRDLFKASVRTRLDGVSRPGLLLSGGIDSGSVACLAGELRRDRQIEPLTCFSAMSANLGACSEKPYIDAVLSHTGFPSVVIQPSEIHGRRIFSDGEPSEIEADPFDRMTRIIPQMLYSIAREHDVRVVMDGVDGDVPLWPGFLLLAHYFRRGQLWKIAENISGLRRWTNTTYRRITARYILLPLIPPGLRKRVKRLVGRSTIDRYVSLINPQLARRTGLLERIEEATLQAGSIAPSVRKQHERNFLMADLAGAAEAYDRMASRYSIEPRHPFLDRPLAEFAIALPPEEQVRNGWPKAILRTGMADILPPEIRWKREKTDLGNEYFAPLRNYYRTMIDVKFSELEPFMAPFFDLPRLRKLRDAIGTGRTGGQELIELLPAIAFGVWSRALAGPNEAID